MIRKKRTVICEMIDDKIIRDIETIMYIIQNKPEQTTDDYKIYDILNIMQSLLKPVKPKREHSGSGVTWWNVCGSCRTAINPNDKFCHECGRKVEWD